MEHLLICSCGEVIVKSQDNTIKLRSKILVFRDGNAFAICKGCGKEYPAPVKLDQPMMKSLTDSRPKLFVRKSR